MKLPLLCTLITNVILTLKSIFIGEYYLKIEKIPKKYIYVENLNIARGNSNGRITSSRSKQDY
jgi:hypothetical protein